MAGDDPEEDLTAQLLRTIDDYRLISTPQILRLFCDESSDGLYRVRPTAVNRGAETIAIPKRRNAAPRLGWQTTIPRRATHANPALSLAIEGRRTPCLPGA